MRNNALMKITVNRIVLIVLILAFVRLLTPIIKYAYLYNEPANIYLYRVGYTLRHNKERFDRVAIYLLEQYEQYECQVSILRDPASNEFYMHYNMKNAEIEDEHIRNDIKYFYDKLSYNGIYVYDSKYEAPRVVFQIEKILGGTSYEMLRVLDTEYLYLPIQFSDQMKGYRKEEKGLERLDEYVYLGDSWFYFKGVREI